jgi:hypothetical protein
LCCFHTERDKQTSEQQSVVVTDREMLLGTSVVLSIAQDFCVYLYLAISATARGGGLAVVQLFKALKPPGENCTSFAASNSHIV